MNKYRITAFHIVFFIFIISNVGGCLTPIGDPPLFLGYLLGVPFWWIAEHCWMMWLTAVATLLAIFYVLDAKNYRRAPIQVRLLLAEPSDIWRFEGMSNLFFLAVILGALFINQPLFLREILMFGAAIGSYFVTPRRVHLANHFSFHPIHEVAILFVGIFATMMPALDWLQLHAKTLGNASPGLYYWGTGFVSSVLDNAPTYLSFMTAVFGSIDQEIIVQVQNLVQAGGATATSVAGTNAPDVLNTIAALQKYHGEIGTGVSLPVEAIEIAYLVGNPKSNLLIVAVSVGAVFFGAATYIGNGPNFMVKAIAEQQKLPTPSFIGYVGRFALPYLLPMLLLVWWIFFRHQ